MDLILSRSVSSSESIVIKHCFPHYLYMDVSRSLTEKGLLKSLNQVLPCFLLPINEC